MIKALCVKRSLVFSALSMAVLTATLLTLPTAANAQWRWRDKTGQINASDRPPPRDVPDKDILSRPNTPDARRAGLLPAAAGAADASASAAAPTAPNAPAASAPPTALEREVQARKKSADEDKANKSRAEEERVAQARAENCRSARNQLTALESGQRIARSNDKGEREVLDDKGRAEEMRRAREVISSECR